MGLRWGLSPLPSLRPEEKVLLFKKWVWGMSAKSWPTYRVSFSLPPVWDIGLYITDRRVLLVASFLRLLAQELSLWFDGRGEPDDDETVRTVGIGRGWLCGPYLELVSEGSAVRWYRSPQLRLRLFMKHPETAHRTIAETMSRNSKAG